VGLTVEPHAASSSAADRRLGVTSELRRHLAKIEALNRRDREQQEDVDDRPRSYDRRFRRLRVLLKERKHG